MSTILLNETSNKINVSTSLAIRLKEHQLTSVYAMNELERTGKVNRTINSFIHRYRIYEEEMNLYFSRTYERPLEPIEYTIETNYGILADVVGSGKTYIILGLLDNNLIPPPREKIISSGIFCSLKYLDRERSLKTNLIIVPHNLVTQWKQAFAYSKLKTFVISKNSDVNFLIYPENIFVDGDNNKIVPSKIDTEQINFDKYVENELNTLEYYDVIICSSTMIDNYIEKFKNINYSRIIIDEVCSISLPQDINLNANFIWFITATPSGMEQIRRYYIRDLVSCGRLHKFIFNNIIIKNNDDYVGRSMGLPNLNQILIRCFTPKQLEIVREFIPADVMDMLNAGNMKDAVLKLNCNVDTNDNILQVITNKITTTIHNKKAELVYQESIRPRDVDVHNENINRLKEKIKGLELKLESITNRIKEFNKENCPVCCEEFSNVTPSILPCCNQLFCISCLTQIKNHKCPLCRTVYNMKDVHVIMDNVTKNKVEQPKSTHEITKCDAVIKIIKEKPHGKFLLFSNYDQTFVSLINKLNEHKIEHSKVMGSGPVVNKIIERFKNGTIRVLMLNATNYGSGLNLQMATDVIIYHQLSLELETQVIGRAQRIGRIEPLNVYYLLHTNEHSNVTNPILSIDLSFDVDIKELDKHLQIKNINSDTPVQEPTAVINASIVQEPTAVKPKRTRKIATGQTTVVRKRKTKIQPVQSQRQGQVLDF